MRFIGNRRIEVLVEDHYLSTFRRKCIECDLTLLPPSYDPSSPHHANPDDASKRAAKKAFVHSIMRNIETTNRPAAKAFYEAALAQSATRDPAIAHLRSSYVTPRVERISTPLNPAANSETATPMETDAAPNSDNADTTSK